MASFKITDLTELAGGSVNDSDVLEIVDLDADQSKKVTIASLKTVFSGGGVSEGSSYTGGTSNGIMFNDGDTFATSSNFVFDGETLTHTLTNGQTEDAFQINSFGNTGGDLARIMSNGNIVLNGDTATDSTVIDITSPSSDFVIRHGVKVTSTGNSNSAYYAFYANVTGTTPYSFYAASGRAFINGTLDLNYNSLLNVGNTKFIGVPSTQYGNLLVSDESDFSAGSGGQLVFGGNPVGQTGYRAAYGIIKGVKENSTYNNNLGGLAFYTNNQASGYLPLLSTLTERMRINSDGNVGIGATSPSAKLHTSLSTDIVGNRLDLSNGQTADAFQINSFGNTGGDLLHITSSGKFVNADIIRTSYDGTTTTPAIQIGDSEVGLNGLGYDSANGIRIITGGNQSQILNKSQIRFKYWAGGASPAIGIYATDAVGTTNGRGSSLVLSGGRSTGNANGGDIIFKSSLSGVSGTSLNSLVEVARITNSGSVGIGATSIDASAKFQIDSTTQGALLPRMTTTQRDAISSPATGLLIFNTTTKKLDYYSGTAWGQV